MFIYTYPNPCHLGGYVVAFRLPDQQLESIKEWCYNTYGEPSILYGPDARWYDGIQFGEILFKNERDLTLFLLKWSGE